MNEQEIEIILRKKLLKVITTTKLQDTFKKVGALIVEIMRDRTDDGFDIYGSKFGGYNRSYRKAYALKYAGGKFGTTTYVGNSSVSGGRTPLRLTGHLFSAMDYEVIQIQNSGTFIKAKIKVFVNDKSQEGKVEGLLSTTGTARNGQTYAKKAWKFLGLSVSGSRVQRERNEINSLLRKDIGLIISNLRTR